MNPTVWNHLFGEVMTFVEFFSFGAMGYNVTYILFWNECLFLAFRLSMFDQFHDIIM